MNSNINLISTTSGDLELKHKRLLIARILAVISLSVVALLSVVIFILTAQIPIATIKNNESSTLNDISYLHAKSAKLYLADDRVNNISNIIATRKTYSDTVNKITKLMPSDLSIDAFSIDSSKIIMTVSGSSLLSVSQFLDSYVAFGNTGKIINKVIVNSLVLNVKSGRYSLSITASLL